MMVTPLDFNTSSNDLLNIALVVLIVVGILWIISWIRGVWPPPRP